jgi:hypothetical protein
MRSFSTAGKVNTQFLSSMLLISHATSAVCIWKRAQILVAETWAAFYPPPSVSTHPIFPGPRGAEIHKLTMFADYRVPQILHHLKILTYPPSLKKMLTEGTILSPGSPEEVSIRVASIVSVERVREAIIAMQAKDSSVGSETEVSSVLIDFFLWDLAKGIESGEEFVDGVETAAMLPAHRTRSIWY